jgi:uncharacterized protein with von Willebrand factor type A (vWA) domain
MPVDVLLLLDVSGSMQSHIQRLSDAAHQALLVLGEQDRVAVMVFDRQSRLRMPFRSNRQTVEREIQNVLRMESFDGGTDITQALHYAANYIAREGRKEARRAIVILTDDETEFNRDDRGVLRSLARADSVLSALLAPDAMASGGVRWARRWWLVADGWWRHGRPVGRDHLRTSGALRKFAVSRWWRSGDARVADTVGRNAGDCGEVRRRCPTC